LKKPNAQSNTRGGGQTQKQKKIVKVFGESTV